MGLRRNLPNSVRIGIAEEDREAFDDFNTYCIVEGQRFAQVVAEVIKDRLEVIRQTSDFDASDWLTWDEFKAAMKREGYTINRTTIFNYRKARPDHYKEMVKTDGVSTRYHFIRILEHFQNS